MAHLRKRHITAALRKKARFWPVVGVLGARQSGKSTLLRELFGEKESVKYVSMDRLENRERAAKSPDHFLQNACEGFETLIIDEAQKSPTIFDAIKAEVDERRRPGRFLISGSTEFSVKTGVRESLTGRIGLTLLSPLTVSEVEGLSLTQTWTNFKSGSVKVSPAAHARYLRQGGMPGICFLRSETERQSAINGWLETTCLRDLQQIRGLRLDGQLAIDILSTLARLEEPTATEIAARLKKDVRRVKNHLDALERIFVVHRLDPHPLGVGKPEYQIFDTGMAHFLGASERALLRIWTMNECLVSHEAHGLPRPRIYYYRSSKKSRVDLVIEKTDKLTGIILTDEAAPSTYSLRAAHAFVGKAENSSCIVLAPALERYAEGGNILIEPWTKMV